MAHCGCDPESELWPGPLPFSLFFGFHVSPCLQFDRLVSKAPPSGAYCLGPVAAWAAECSDTAWICSFIIRQMGWSRCGPCGDSGAVWGVRQGPAASPFQPHPTATSTEGAGWTGCSWGVQDPLLPLPLAPSSPYFPLPFCRSELSLLESGGLFCPKTHSHNIWKTVVNLALPVK